MHPPPDSPEWQALRDRMVEEQLIPKGIRDLRVLDAMRRIPRQWFVPPDIEPQAYENRALPIGREQTISQPLMVALMLQALSLQGQEKVLEVGGGYGYEAALLGLLAREVHSLEVIPELARQAAENLARLCLPQVHVHAVDGSGGLPSEAPFDAIIVAAAAPHVPEPLVGQLAREGRLVIPVAEGEHEMLYRLNRKNGEVERTKLGECVFVPLTGEYGYREPRPGRDAEP